MSIVEGNGLEPHRLERIVLPIREPLIWVAWEMPFGGHSIIDGSHRYVAAWRQGARELKSYVLKPEHYERFLIGTSFTTPPLVCRRPP